VHPTLAADLAELPAVLEAARRSAEHVLAGLDTRPAAHATEPTGQPHALPDGGNGAQDALGRFLEHWEPGFSGSAGPRFLGFVTGGTTPAALVGDWLTSALDQNVHGAAGSSAARLERETVGWLRELFGLNDDHEGTFVSGATMSNFVGLATGREWLGKQAGVSVTQDGAAALGPVRVLSGTPHASTYKALSMLGIGRRNLHTVPCLTGREAIDVAALDHTLAELDGQPAIVVANAGTVNTTDFDDLRAIAALRERHPFWLHVDAAFGGFAALSPEHSPLVDGLNKADSICIDLHKWLNVPYDSAIQFTRHRTLQTSVFANWAAYLGTPADDTDFSQLTPENSRRLRALPAWFSLTAYGRDGHRSIVETNTALARRLANRIANTPSLHMLAPSDSTSSASPSPINQPPNESTPSPTLWPRPARRSSPRRCTLGCPHCALRSATGAPSRPMPTGSTTPWSKQLSECRNDRRSCPLRGHC
jgi:glutamate/tyrosine decarboxylase-like PLP-dependent enzyme